MASNSPAPRAAVKPRVAAQRLRPDKTIRVKWTEAGAKTTPVKVKGYAVTYRYRDPGEPGGPGKLLHQIRQGGRVAEVEWESDSTPPRIRRVRVTERGDPEPMGSVEYSYDNQGRLDIVKNSVGVRTQVVYHDSGDRIEFRNLLPEDQE